MNATSRSFSKIRGIRVMGWNVGRQTRKVLTAFAITAAFISPTLAVAQNAITIGVSLGVDGRYKSPSRMQKAAYELWESHQNANGGLLGRPVEMVFLDDNGEKEQAVANYEFFTGEEGTDLVIGPYSSGLTIAVAPVIDARGFAFLAAGASADSVWAQGFESVFGMWTPASKYSVSMLKQALRLGWTKVAVIGADDAFSKSIAGGADKWAGRLPGFEVVHKDTFVKGTRDLTAIAEEIRDNGADLVFMGGHLNESLDLANAFTNIGWRPKGLWASVGPTFEAFQSELGDAADCVFTTSIWEPTVDFPGSKEFNAAFVEENGQSPTYHAATAYAAGQILAEAVTTAGTIEQSELRLVLAEMDTYSIIGRYTVDRTGLQAKRFPLLIQWQDGQKEIISPEDRRTADPKVDCGQ